MWRSQRSKSELSRGRFFIPFSILYITINAKHLVQSGQSGYTQFYKIRVNSLQQLYNNNMNEILMDRFTAFHTTHYFAYKHNTVYVSNIYYIPLCWKYVDIIVGWCVYENIIYNYHYYYIPTVKYHFSLIVFPLAILYRVLTHILHLLFIQY